MSNIIEIGGGGSGSAVLIPKTITANGVYSASSDSADGYDVVTVNVESGGFIPVSLFDFFYNKNTSTPSINHISNYEVALSFTDQNSTGYELCSFSVPLNKGIYIAEIKATVDKNTGLASQYTWGIYSANASGGANINANTPKETASLNTYVPFDTSDTSEHTYYVPINIVSNGTGYICFATAADNGVNATISVSSLRIKKVG